MAEIVVRWATVEDAHDIAVVHVEAWRVAYRELLPHDVLEALSVDDRAAGWFRWLTRSLSSEPTDDETGPVHRLIVACVDGSLIGWASFGNGRDAGEVHRGELAGLYVHPEKWGHEAGAALLGRAEEELSSSGLREPYLWVLEGNERAISFYERHGWMPDGGEKWMAVGAGNELRELRHSR